jgi:hypothetical protein
VVDRQHRVDRRGLRPGGIPTQHHFLCQPVGRLAVQAAVVFHDRGPLVDQGQQIVERRGCGRLHRAGAGGRRGHGGAGSHDIDCRDGHGWRRR